MRSIPRILLLGAVLALAIAGSARAEGTTTVIHFQPEGLPALEGQLRHHEVHAVTLHPGTGQGHAHVSMSNGRHYTVLYTAGDQAHLVALAQAGGARYAVATVKASTAKPVHHKLRYIAGGILIVVIVVVAAVLLVDRRRKLNEGAQAAAAPGDSAT